VEVTEKSEDGKLPWIRCGVLDKARIGSMPQWLTKGDGQRVMTEGDGIGDGHGRLAMVTSENRNHRNWS